MEQVLEFFSFDGRVSRKTFWINTAAVLLANIILIRLFVHQYLGYDWQVHTSISHKPIYFPAALVIGLRLLSITARRWHDLGWTGWLAGFNVFAMLPGIGLFDLSGNLYQFWLLSTAIGGFVAVGFLGFDRGDPAPNEYGSREGREPKIRSSSPLSSPAMSFSSVGASRSYSPHPPPPPRPPASRSATANALSRPPLSTGFDTAIAQQSAMGVASGSHSTGPTGEIRVRTESPGLDICLTDGTSRDSHLIFDQTRYVLLSQLRQHGMGVAQIKTNSRSDQSATFEASLYPHGEVKLTRHDEAASSVAFADALEPCVYLAFSGLKLSQDAADSMVRAISSDLQKQFDGITLHESSAPKFSPA